MRQRVCVACRLPVGDRVQVPCPQLVVDYQRWVGGVDVHDQLRLQRYSLELAFVFKKYYKSNFLSLVNVALENTFIAYKESARQQGRAALRRDEFYQTLQAQLLAGTADDFSAIDVSARMLTLAPTCGLHVGWTC